MKTKQIDVTIMGQTYVLGVPPGGDDKLMEAVRIVDREMTAIKEAGKVKSRERIAVLAALNQAYATVERASEPKTATIADEASAPASPSAASAADGNDPTIAALMRRLDEAIATDDRLL